jgi:hypothetical protein
VASGGGLFLPLAGGSMDVNAAIDFSDTTVGTVSEVGGYGFAVSSASNSALVTNVLFDRVFVKNATSQTTIKPTGVQFPDSTLQVTAFPGFTGYAPLASPAFTGNPTAPTPTSGDNDTSIATTAFVQSAIIAGSAHAETLQAEVRNNTGATLAPFTVVYINGALGNKATVAKAQANAESTSAGTFAITESSIADNANGNVISAGVLANVDTSSFTDGDKLYLSPTVAGGVTTTKPSAPNHLVYVGVVTRSHPTLGTVSVRIQNGYELGEIHDVALASEANNDLLVYETSTALWKNKSFSTLGLLTSAIAASTYAPIASPTFTGTVTIPAGASISGYLTSSTAASTYQTLSGMSSYLTTASASTTYASLAGATFTGTIYTNASTTSGPSIRIPAGTAPTTPILGDLWFDGTNFKAGIGGAATGTIPFLYTTNTWTGTNNFSGTLLSFGTSTATSTFGIGNGSTVSGSTKTVNVGTFGLAGSTTNIAIGSTTGTSTTTLQGTTNGITAAADTNSVALATTAYVVGQASATAPVIDGTAAVGTSLKYARADHVHPTDTSRAALASPSLTGTPLSTTAAADTNTTQIATTAYVIGQASSTTPSATGTAAVGTSLKYARADHVHANPLPTGGTTGQVLSKVDATSYNVAWTTVASGGGTWGSITGTLSSQTDLQSALDAKLSTATAASTYAPLASPTFTGTVTIPAGASISGYLTTSTAASTYQTLSGMSSYLTTATAATTYAPLASPTLTGVPTAPTALSADSSTTIATTAFVKAQGYLTSAPVTSVAGRTGAITLANTDISGLGTMSTATAADYSTTTAANALYYPLSGNPSGFLTSAPVSSVAGRTGAITLAVADVSGAAPLASPALTGTPTAPTATVSTNTTQVATTAYVVGQAGSATPVVDGTAAVGTSLLYARQDHVHPTDTSRAALASPTFTGTPLSTTAAVDTNTTQIATTAYVMGQGYAKLASPTFTGTPTLPTGTIATTQTALDSSTKVATTAFVRADNNCKAWVNFNGTGTPAIRGSYNVSSITDNGVGDYTVNLTTAISDANYSVQANSSYSANGARGSVWAESYATSTTSTRIITSSLSSPFFYDCVSVTVAILR